MSRRVNTDRRQGSKVTLFPLLVCKTAFDLAKSGASIIVPFTKLSLRVTPLFFFGGLSNAGSNDSHDEGEMK